MQETRDAKTPHVQEITQQDNFLTTPVVFGSKVIIPPFFINQ